MNAGCHKTIEPGTRFSKLVCGSFVGFNERRNALYEFTCDCGNKKIISASAVRLGEVKSCGCLPAERMKGLSSQLAEDLTGQNFGELKVIERHPHKDRGGCFFYSCLCSCGNVAVIRSTELVSGKRIDCARWMCKPEIKQVISEVETAETRVKNIYFAGHFDGEGCVQFQPRGEGAMPGLIVRVSGVYKPTIEEYLAYFGGWMKIIPRDGRRMARVQWRWGVTAYHEVLRFLRRVAPYCKEKKAQIDLAHGYLMVRLQNHKYLSGKEHKPLAVNLMTKMQQLKRYEFKN